MKKMVGVLCVLLAGGCSLSAREESGVVSESTSYAIENNAVLSIRVEDKNYAKALYDLWNVTYPNHKDALKIKVKKPLFSQHIEGDIAWVSDRDVVYQRAEALPLKGLKENMELKWKDSLERVDNEDFFVPVTGKGLVFVRNLDTMRKRHVQDSDMDELESLASYQDEGYYQNRLPDYVYPLLFQGYQPLEEDLISQEELLQDEAFEEKLHEYRKLNDEMFLVDDLYEKDSFYLDGHYLCGLVMNDASYVNSEEYRKGHLQFSAMPTWKGEQLSPLLDTYGFVVNKNTRYPHAVYAFLSMVRSKEGITALLDHTSSYPLVMEEDIASLQIFDTGKKEILAAMNHSQLRSGTYIKEKPSIAIDALFKKSDFYSILQNSLYTKEKDERVIKELVKDMKLWIYKQ